MNEVRQGHYDVAVLSEAPWRTAAAVAAAQVPVRIGLARHRNDTFLTHVLAAQDPQQPVVREQGRLLKALGIDARARFYRLDPDASGGHRSGRRRDAAASFRGAPSVRG